MRQKKRQTWWQLALALLLALLLFFGLTSHSVTLAQSRTRTLTILTKDESILIPDLTPSSFQLRDFDWSTGKKGQRIFVRQYADLAALAAETGFWPLENPLNSGLAQQSKVTLVYHEAEGLVRFTPTRHFLGNTRAYHEEVLLCGDLTYSYATDQTGLYQTPLNLSICFLALSGPDLTEYGWEFYSYTEQYTSPDNGLVSYLLSSPDSIGTGSEKEAFLLATGQADKLIAFAHKNIFTASRAVSQMLS